jgi:hypothetical protein
MSSAGYRLPFNDEFSAGLLLFIVGGSDGAVGDGVREAEPPAGAGELHGGDAAGAGLPAPAGGPPLRPPRLVRHRRPSGQARQEFYPGARLQGMHWNSCFVVAEDGHFTEVV